MGSTKVLLVLVLLTSLSSVHTEMEDLLTSSQCSTIVLMSRDNAWSMNYSFTEGEEISENSPILFGYDRKRMTTVYKQFTEKGCKVQVCYDLEIFSDPKKRIGCSNLTNDYVEFMGQRNYKMTGARCNCQKNSSYECWRLTEGCPSEVTDDKACHLYTGIQCDTCTNGFFRLSNGSEFRPTISTPQFRSLILKKNCHLIHEWTEPSETLDSTGNPKRLSHRYTESTPSIEESWDINDSLLKCICGLDAMKEEEKNQYLGRIIVSSMGVLAVALLAVGIMRFKWASILKAFQKKQALVTDIELKAVKLSQDGPENLVPALIEPTALSKLEEKWIQIEAEVEKWGHVRKISYAEILFGNEHEIEITLGRGEYGMVLQARLTAPTEKDKSFTKAMEIAVKKPSSNMSDHVNALAEELKILGYVGDHENIVRLIGYFKGNLDLGELYLAFELMTNDSLRNYVHRMTQFAIDTNKAESSPYCTLGMETVTAAQLPISVSQMITWSLQIVTGLEFLHEKQVIHRDLAARNVLLTCDLVAKLGDFGLARQINAQTLSYTQLSDDPVPWKWMAMKALKRHYSYQTDIWSFGVTAWEIFQLAGHQEPYADINNQEVLLEKLSPPVNYRLEKPTYATVPIYNMMLDCWSTEASSRPNATELKRFFHQQLFPGEQ